MAETVARRLKGLIVEGDLPPGTPLRLAQIAERLGVSVMPVRDALRLLESERLVVLTPRRGAVVAELSLEDAEETYAIRVALESLAARHAIGRVKDADLAEIRELFGRMIAATEAGCLKDFIAADHDFHMRLYAASGREQLVRHISDLVDRSRRYAPYAYRAWQPLDSALAAHRPLFEAILARDPSLVELLTREHMAAATRRLLADIQRETEARARLHGPRPRREPAPLAG